MAKRIAEVCQAIIATGKYEPKRDNNGSVIETYCNFFVRDVALESKGYVGLKNMTANIMVAFLDGSGEWMEIDTEKAQAAANEDKLVVAGWANVEETKNGEATVRVVGGHGHVCVVVPGVLTFSGQRKTLVPLVANVGKENFYGKPMSFAFSKSMDPVRYFLHV